MDEPASKYTVKKILQIDGESGPKEMFEVTTADIKNYTLDNNLILEAKGYEEIQETVKSFKINPTEYYQKAGFDPQEKTANPSADKENCRLM